MELTLKRTIKMPTRTIGELSINGKKFCDTVEDVERLFFTAGKLLGVKVYGKTAIPLGRYEVAMTFSNRFKKVMPILLNVPQFEGIRIHSGNTELDTEGCIIVGKYDPKAKIIGYGTSRKTTAELYTILTAACAKGKVYITIS